MDPADIERARRILRTVHQHAVERLVSFVVENEETLVSRGEFDSSGATERLSGFQQEIFTVSFLLGSLPAPPQPPVEST
jgi:hypothetical protein